VNTYDPMDRIVYRHLASHPLPTSVAPSVASPVALLPGGYANSSPRTYLGRTRRSASAA